MATKQDLTNAVNTLTATVGTAISEQAAAFQRLEDLINSGGDFQAEVDALNASNTNLLAAIEVAKTKGVPVP